MALEDYRLKRDFAKTAEPRGSKTEEAGMRFVVHEHHARHLHFDLRLEMNGVLKSWAIPKGPSMNPVDKRLAVMVEDHPMDYISFRGEIAEGNYGAGEVEIWDSGTYDILENKLDQGKLLFEMHGTKLKGRFSLVRLKDKKSEWLLIKGHDDYADPNWELEQIIPGKSHKDTQKRETTDDAKAQASDPMPDIISPMLATLVEKPFSDLDWLFEPKWDGYRAISFIKRDSFRFASRKNEDLLLKFPQAQAIPGFINAETAILDGELIAIDKSGTPSFQLLQNAAQSISQGAQLVYYVFDLLYYNGSDFRKRPLIERKEMLQSIIRPNEFLKYCDHIIEKGEQLYKEAERSGLEGIMAKRMQSPYIEKRSNYWLKIKTVRQQEVVIGGYTRPRRSRGYFGALLLGVYEEGKLVFAGHVGTGFDDATLKQLYELMQPLVIDECPFATKPVTNEPATWVKPELACEVKFAQWTDENIMRQPVFLGLRQDILPTDVVREKPIDVETTAEPQKPKSTRKHVIAAEEIFEQKDLRGDVCVSVDGVEVPLTNLDKIYWPDEGYTKGDLLRYYYKIRETIIPHLADRPLILRRFPNGINGDSFYQHNLEEAPDFIKRVKITEDGETINYAIINDTASLLYIANLGCIAQNPFNSRIESLDKPDWIVLDLDPEEAPFDTVCEVAMAVKEVLDEANLLSYPKTSGSRGMHIYVPIEKIYSHEQAQNFGKIVASIVASRIPKIATIERVKKERTVAQVYVDYLQNAEGKTMASPYSVRAYPGATVSTPLTWEEVKAKPDKGQFNMLTVPDRVAEVGDLFHDVLTQHQKLTAAIECLETLVTKVKNQ